MQKLPNVLIGSLLAGFLTFAATNPVVAQSVRAAVSMPKVGDVAPDFTLNYVQGDEEKSVSLSQYRGQKNVVLAFYIFAFTGG